eukprot:CAMPEP_0185030450 /NCGR_PEP_ID=MMETSP1103-20130426/17432_1 /TAXON_ID=36769 /ORGANISM="Paraphysomonas bandaiensis, Strain Caron Lab Isolate" /LENGTH=202 /DNA_ID=CAMNT_0027565595 /DNA_START=453 /DNA_END=1061 /DNA_ORIENTATION=-
MNLPTIHKKNVPHGSYPCKGFEAEHIEDRAVYEVEGATVQAVYTPGHTDDHVAFVLKEDEALLSGDCVLGCGTAVFDDLHTYMKSLALLRSLFTTNDSVSSVVRRIYPGHGPVISDSAVEKIDEYVHHRNLRETQIRDFLVGSNNIWNSSWEVMTAVYPNLPVHVKVSAQWNTLHHLEKLCKDGMVETMWPDLWRVKKVKDY